MGGYGDVGVFEAYFIDIMELESSIRTWLHGSLARGSCGTSDLGAIRRVFPRSCQNISFRARPAIWPWLAVDACQKCQFPVAAQAPGSPAGIVPLWPPPAPDLGVLAKITYN